MNFPPSFDPDFYMQDKPFLTSQDAAYDHFVTTGRHQGLKGSPCSDGGHFIKLIRDLAAESILEIGAGCSPKMQGDGVKYFDVKSKEELQQRYRNEPGYAAIPEKIHYVAKNGDLRRVEEKFDIVFSSHVIEHTLDLIEHINGVEALLRDDGLYFVMVPNKNYTFDRFKPETLLEDVLAQHFERKGQPSMRTVLLEKCRRTHNSPARHWEGDHGEISLNKDDLLSTINNFNKTASDFISITGYHNWIFTDETFPDLINSLYELEVISLKLYECYNTPKGGMTFSAILGR
jgi:hypothetical protein